MSTKPVEYIRITHDRYAKSGFTPYRYFHSDTPPPWTPMKKPLAECRLGVLVSGGAYVAGQVAFHYKDDSSMREIPKSVDVSDLRFAHVTEYMLDDARRDPDCLVPVTALRRLEAEGAVGSVADTFYSCMGGIYSQRRAREELAPAALAAVQSQGADAVLLVPFCPICHQTMSLIARHIEAAGLPTVVVGSALDIVRAVQPPRTVFVDYPLGHTVGAPGDPDGQYAIVRDVLAQFERLSAPGDEAALPYQWGDGETWKAEAYAQQEDKRGPRDETPRYQLEADRILAEQRLAEQASA